MASLEFELQKAIYDALQGMTVIAADGGSVSVQVFDHQPDNQPFPFVTIAGVNSSAIDPLDGSLTRVMAYLAVWSQYRGQRQVLEIQSAIRDRLHNADLALDGWECVLVRVSESSVVGEPDDQTYQGAMTITATVSD